MTSDQIDRFLAAVARLTGSTSNKDIPRLGLAVSGGPDSLALLLLAHEALPDKIAAASVDHGLRSEAKDEAQYVARICNERRIPHAILTPARPITGNIQSEARKVRYALLAQWAEATGCRWIATAHHADDQLETMLMRLARSSGVDGLSGIRAVNGRIIRPLLQYNKAELVAICAQAGVAAVNDPSNADVDFDRVRVRNWLASSRIPVEASAAAQSAANLAEASEALDWMASSLANERISRSGAALSLDANALPRELQRRLLLLVLRRIDPVQNPRGAAMARLLDALSAGETAMIGDILCKGGKLWQFSIAPPRKQG